jgi:pSer/pThr/pTyr-binding forkhead associated (FHA) protein
MAKLQIFFPDGSEITHDLPEEKTFVGRISENQLQIPDDSLSSRHAEIIFENANFYVRDVNSTNGTFVNGSKIESAVLNHGDEVRFGSVACLFLSESSDSTTTSGSAPIAEQKSAIQSVRPANFTSFSPIPPCKNGKDLRPLAVTSAALIGILAASTALYLIFQFSP